MTFLWESFVQADVKTLILTLVWESLFAAIIVLLCLKYTSQERDKKQLGKTALLETTYLISFCLLYGRGTFPDWISSTVANLLLYLAFYLELMITLHAMHLENFKMHRFFSIHLIISCILYLLQDTLISSPSYRIALSSLVIVLFFTPFIIFVIQSKDALPMHRLATYASIPVVIAAALRGLHALLDDYQSLLDYGPFQTVVFLALLIKLYCTPLYLFLFIKVDSDSEIKKLAATDGLTGLINRRTYLMLGSKLFHHCKYENKMFGVIFLDIDHFKTINDQYGHGKGDDILIAFSNTINRHLRPQDISCRYGGDEFCACFELPSLDVGAQIAERIRLETAKITLSDTDCISTSIGLAYGIPSDNNNFEDFIKVADTAMYESKRAGRNQCFAIDISTI